MPLGELDRWVVPAVRRRVRGLVAELDVLREGDGECLPLVMAELRELLGLDLTLSYRVVPANDGWDLDFLRLEGPIETDEFVRAYLKALEQASFVGAYDPVRPPSGQRNRVVRPRELIDDGDWVSSAAGLASEELGLVDFDELRVLICDGGSMLAWVGGFRREPFTKRDRAVLRAIVPALRRRLVLERRLHTAELSHEALCVALDAVDGAAFVIRSNGQVVFSNGAGRAMLERDDVRDELRDALEGRPGYRVVPIQVPGVVDHYLVVVEPAGNVPFERAVELRGREWALTPRQVDVLRLVVRGASNRTAAAELGISPRTVELHVAAVLEKARVSSRAQLVAEFWDPR
jgi:DNA-binding CsgD family transcriptional regulator